ncbi:PAS domain S-box protein [Effusibacillus consociatus]|uniref:histidine kinase n=1 Tax=Effusibacillus consociatus TaxID=1117041 RepID=A0ABV9Q697_9BACL
MTHRLTSLKLTRRKRIMIYLVLCYVLALGLWIPVTDHILKLYVSDIELLTHLQTAKGLFTVLLTAIMLYGILYRNLFKMELYEKQLEESAECYKSLVEHNPDAIFSFDLSGNILTANPVCEKITGYRIAELIGLNCMQLVTDEGREQVREHFARSVKGEPQLYETKIIHKTGHLIDVRVKTAPILLHDQVVGFYGIMTDITKQKQAEEELRATKETLESFVNNTSDGIIILDLQYNVLQVNNAWQNMLGWTAEEVIGRKLPSVPEEYIPVVEKLHQEVLAGGRITGFECRALHKDGQPINISVTISPIRDANGDVIAFAGIVRDITEKKRVEEALRESEAKYRLIAENMTDMIGVTDPQGIFQYASPSIRTVLGFTPEEYVGKRRIDCIHPDDLIGCQQALARTEAEKIPVGLEFRHKHKDGHWVTIEAYFIPVTNENGELQSIIFVGRDRSELKKAEELLQKSDKLSLVGQMAAGVAHEIRNPLTALRGFVQLLQSQTQTADHQQYFQVMLTELDRINFIVNEFLYLAKPQAVNFQRKDLNMMLLDVISLLDGQAILNNVQIKTDFSSDIPYITCEENQLKQVFVNILKNAIEAMPTGGNIEIQVKLQDRNQVSIRFIDQGMGIPPERIPKLGEPFYTTKEKGTGLGLMVSYKIIQEHRGNITIDSEVDKGTVVEITLPV